MRYSEHTFDQTVPRGQSDQTETQQVPGFIAEGTGLGCMRVEVGGRELYAPVHVESGMPLVDPYYGPFAVDRDVAERWIEELATDLDWNRPIRDIVLVLPKGRVDQVLARVSQGKLWRRVRTPS
jgi:hypothetical protein